MTLFVASLSSCYLGHHGVIRASHPEEAKALLGERLRKMGVNVAGLQNSLNFIETKQKEQSHDQTTS